MKTQALERLTSKKKGQAFPLAAVGLFIMALSVLATLNLGQAIHEKIKLQNTADSAAYSLAAIEARAFNFVALTNRSQIANYNTAMALQSYLNYAGFCYFLAGTVRDLIANVESSLAFGCSNFPWPVNTPYCSLRAIFKAIKMGARVIVTLSKFAYEIVHTSAPMAIEALGLFNEYILWHMQLFRLVLINAHIFSGMQEIVGEMYKPDELSDSRMKFMQGNSWMNIIINAVLNLLEFRLAFDRGAGANPVIPDFLFGFLFGLKDYRNFKDRKKDKNKEAVRVMSELANASRSEKSIYNRSGFVFSSLLVSNVFGDKRGMTKLVPKKKSSDIEPQPEVKALRTTENNYVLGDYLASDDFIESGIGLATAGISIVVALPNSINNLGSAIVAAKEKDDRKHYGYKNPKGKPGHPNGSYNGLVAFPPLMSIPKKTVDKDIDCNYFQKHKWPGIAPYTKFNPKADHNSDYNQPSTWMFLNIAPEYIRSERDSVPWHKDFRFNHGGTDQFEFENLSSGESWEHGGHSAGLDTTIGGERSSLVDFLEGLNAISRGMVYYHRPDNWIEHPNFFNPFWRAKLAPVGQKLTQIFDRLTKGMGNDSFENKAFNYALNFIRNFLNDAFFGFVTSVMTH
ncbi:MAG: TadE/TadG family type IV pilus assembly protein [Myxococcota bacterium]